MIDEKTENNVRYRFVGYMNGLPHYEIVDEQKAQPVYTTRSNKPVLGTKGNKHDERE